MKKLSRILFVAALLLSTIYVNAQSPVSNSGKITTTVGLKIGGNLSNLYVNEVSDENAKLGVHAGIFAKIPVAKMFSIQPELLYSQKGSQLEYNNLFAQGRASYNLHYIELPVMAVINLGNNFNIQGGLYTAYLAGVTVKNKGTSTSAYDFEKTINKDNFKSFDFGLAGGFGFDGDKVGFGARYSYGLEKIGRERTVFGQPYSFNNAKNAVLQLYITFGL